ncbi:hypothetical protein F5Y12DRAFT_709517 [Xylaria sp. FL1777]|nr:hypothetical protein F5Y12DRAFT_709517 [Xylaria sp. FL1777]
MDTQRTYQQLQYKHHTSRLSTLTISITSPSPHLRSHLVSSGVTFVASVSSFLRARDFAMPESQDNTRTSDSTSPPVPSAATTQAEMAQAFRDLARGEQQAAAIEANLASIESKLDALLASIEAGGSVKVEGVDEDEVSKKEQSPRNK